MTELMDKAIAALRHVPMNQQDEIAAVVMQLTGSQPPAHDIAYVPSAEEEADLAASEAEADRGEFASDEQVRAIWAKHGL